MSRDTRENSLLQKLIESTQRTNSLIEILIHSQHSTARWANPDCPICLRAKTHTRTVLNGDTAA